MNYVIVQTATEAHRERSIQFTQLPFVSLGRNSFSVYCQVSSRSAAIAFYDAQMFPWGFSRKCWNASCTRRSYETRHYWACSTIELGMRLENWIGNEAGKLVWEWGWKTGLGMRMENWSSLSSTLPRSGNTTCHAHFCHAHFCHTLCRYFWFQLWVVFMKCWLWVWVTSTWHPRYEWYSRHVQSC